MMRMLTTMLMLGCLGGTAALGQPALDSLWPNADGMTFEYDFSYEDLQFGDAFAGPASLALNGTIMTPGGLAQVLVGQHVSSGLKKAGSPPALPGLLAAVWRIRTDLRPVIEARFSSLKTRSSWLPLFLHDGYFMKTPDTIEMWQDGWAHSTWTYLRGEPASGMSFTHQLVPELADDIFLHGTVTSTDASVVTANGTYTGAVRVDYLIDMGINAFTNESGDPVGMAHGEIQGHVYYVPDVGPVAMLQEAVPFVWIDCGEEPCPSFMTEWLDTVVETMSLSLARTPVGNADSSWSELKAMYR